MEGFAALFIIWAIVSMVTGIVRALRGSEDSPQAVPFALRKVAKPIDEQNPSSPEVLHIEARGVVPLQRPAKLRFVTSVLDTTSEGDARPVLSTVERFQEPDSIVFQHIVDVGRVVSPGSTLDDWVRVGAVIPQILVPPTRGQRQLTICVRLVDAENPPPIRFGFGQEHPGLLLTATLPMALGFEDQGYEEEAESRDAARVLAIETALAVAVADGHLDDSEGHVIKHWIERVVASYSGEAAERMKQRLNESLRSAHARAQDNALALDELTSRIREIAPPAQKYETLELCLDVMSADGVADRGELGLIRRIGESIGLDYGEIARMQDVRLPNLEFGGGTTEAALGIDPSWPREKVRAHLRRQFATWNNRLSSLPEGAERENAQKMLDSIAELTKQHARNT